MLRKININDLNVLYEDNHIIVVVKPIGVLSQADNTGDVDMLTIIKEYLKQKYNKKNNVYLGLVHRLDRMVGGVMVFAKTSKAASRLSEYIRCDKFKKKYFAIINGKIEDTSVITLQNYLIKDCENNKSIITNSSNIHAKLAKLDFKAIKNFKYDSNYYTLVDINLYTGRHHQIRAQFANISYPLYGDIKYGKDKNRIGQNLALWSYFLEFEHPVKHSIMSFTFKPNQIINNSIYKKDKIWDVI